MNFSHVQIINDPLMSCTKIAHHRHPPLVTNDYSLPGPKVECVRGAQSYEIERKNLYEAESYRAAVT